MPSSACQNSLPGSRRAGSGLNFTVVGHTCNPGDAAVHSHGDGNDNNYGPKSATWRTIQHAANSVHAGDTVHVMGGVYNESVTIPGSGNATTGYITFESVPDQTAILDRTGINVAKGQQFGLFTLRTNSYIVIKGFEIRNFQSSKGGAV